MIGQEVSVRLWCDIHQEWDGHKTENCPHAQRERRTRGATNRNDRGNTADRTRRKIWLMGAYRSDVTGLRVTYVSVPTPGLGTYNIGRTVDFYPTPKRFNEVLAGQRRIQQIHGYIESIEEIPTCRCYRCGILLTFDTLTVDKIFPQIDGGKYNSPTQDKKAKRTNIRPACYDCNTTTGARLASRTRVPKKARA